MERTKRPDDEKENAAERAGGLTRREWLAEVGTAAVAAALPVRTEPADLETEDSGTALPAGLYTPSSEHLGHALEDDELFHEAPPGSETDYVRPVEGAFKRAFFSTDQFQVIRRMVHLILGIASGAESDAARGGNHEDPVEEVARWIDLRVASAAGTRAAARALSTPHRTLAVHYYGLERVRRLETADPGKVCREGLAWIEEVAHTKHGSEFLNLSEPQQFQMLESIADHDTSPAAENPGTRLVAFLKEESIRGYYTSRRGLRELDYTGNAFYPVSPGCPKKG